MAEGFPEPDTRELGLRVRFVFPLAKSASDIPSIKLPQPVAQLADSKPYENLQQLVAKIPWCLCDIQKPIGVSEHEFIRALPDDLKSSLSTMEEIEAELSGDLPATLRLAQAGMRELLEGGSG